MSEMSDSQPLPQHECAHMRRVLQSGSRLSGDECRAVLTRFQQWFVHHNGAYSDQFLELALGAGYKTERSGRDMLLRKIKEGAISGPNWKIIDNVPPDGRTVYSFNFRGFTEFLQCAGTDVSSAFKAHVNEAYHENATLTSALTGGLPVQVSVGASSAGQLFSRATLLPSVTAAPSATTTALVPFPSSSSSTAVSACAPSSNAVLELVRTHSHLGEGVLLRVVEEARRLEAHQSEKVTAQCQVEETRLKEENRKREIEQKAAEAALREENRKREIEENARIEKMKEDAKTERKRMTEETKRSVGEKRLRDREEALVEEMKKIPRLITAELEQVLSRVQAATSSPQRSSAGDVVDHGPKDPNYHFLQGDLSLEQRKCLEPFVGYYVMVHLCPPDGGIIFVPTAGCNKYPPTKLYGTKHYRHSVQVIMKRLLALVLSTGHTQYSAGDMFSLKVGSCGMSTTRLKSKINELLLKDRDAAAAIEKVKAEKSRVVAILNLATVAAARDAAVPPAPVAASV